jgi:hypothetical protein
MSRKPIRAAVAASLWMLAVMNARSAEAAEPPGCVVQVPGDAHGTIAVSHATPSGLLIGSTEGLFRFDGREVSRVGSDQIGGVNRFFDTEYGLLLATDTGLLRYDAGQLIAPAGAPTAYVHDVQKAFGKLLVASANGLLSYDGARLTAVSDVDTGDVAQLYPLQSGLLLGAEKGLYAFDGVRMIRLGGERVEHLDRIMEMSGPLIVAASGLYRIDGGRVVRAPGSDVKDMLGVYVTARGVLLSTSSRTYRYDAAGLHAIEADDTGYLTSFLDTPYGTLLIAEHGLFVYDGERIKRVDWKSRGLVTRINNTPAGPLISADTGLFRYDGNSLIRIEGKPTGEIRDVLKTANDILLGADKGLFRFDGARVYRLEGDDTAAIDNMQETPNGVLLRADNGFFLAVAQRLATAKVSLENIGQLKDSAPNKSGVLTHWKLSHPCAKFADKFELQVVATGEEGEDIPGTLAFDFQFHDADTSFASLVPVPMAGKWRFRVVSGADRTMIGAQSAPVTFVTGGFIGWLRTWWQTIAASSAVLLAALNLAVFAAARYSPAAWRLATDEIWSKTALLPQRFLLRQWRPAQLWLLDLYVRKRCAGLREARPFLSIPLTNAKGKLADSDAVLARLRDVRRVWIQGGAGMGKTALFHHLHETHFGGAERTSFALFRRDGYVLVPIEARRFTNVKESDSDASIWVVECVRSVLSENGLTLDDQGLVRSMLSTGALAVAIDGLNEVARDLAVASFAAGFPEAPLFVTSQELGDDLFEAWKLPGTISEYVEGLLALYLGAERAVALTQSLKTSGLFEYLRSGYDVRLVVDLAKADPDGKNMPRDRIGLYRATVAAAWSRSENRDEDRNILQAAAWKLISERGPNQDKRRLTSDDAPDDLLKRLATVPDIRIVRPTSTGYEFVHDQMNAYLAACYLADQSNIEGFLRKTNAWFDGREAQRGLWGFLATLLDRSRLESLWVFAGDDADRAVLGTALAERAGRENWSLIRPANPVAASRQAHGAEQ